MEKWCKIISVEGFDVLIKKRYDSDDDKYKVDITVCNDTLAEITTSMVLKELDEINEAFDNLNSKAALKVVKDFKEVFK